MRKLASFMGLMLLILTTSIFTSCKPEPKPEPKVYTVTFDADGGSEVAAIKVKSGEKAVQPDDPVKEGYVFDAWYNGEAKYDWETPVTADITLTANWEAKTYTVTFVDEEVIDAQEVAHGAKAEKPAEDPKKDGFTFAGWLNGDTAYDFESPVTSDLELKAKWDVVKYSITFEVEGVEKIVVETGKTAEKQKPADPTKEGYTFAGWLNGEEAYDWTKPVTADVVLKASWEVIEYKINYVLPEGVTTDNPATYTIETEVITLKDAKVPEGKYFGGWFIDKEYKTAATSIEKGSTGDKTFYAKLNDNPTFTLTLKDGEKEYLSLKVEEGKTAEKQKPADPTKDGYTFKGWLNAENAYDWTKPVTGDLTLTASWEINKYTVTIDGVSQTVEHGKVLTKPDAPAAVAGKEFKGWYNGKEPYDWTKPVTSNLSLTQKWDVVKYKITFDVDGGSEVKPFEVDYETVANEPAAPTKQGHLFAGWFVGEVAYDWSAKVKENLTLKAKWNKALAGIFEFDTEYNGWQEWSMIENEKSAGTATIAEPPLYLNVNVKDKGLKENDTIKVEVKFASTEGLKQIGVLSAGDNYDWKQLTPNESNTYEVEFKLTKATFDNDLLGFWFVPQDGDGALIGKKYSLYYESIKVTHIPYVSVPEGDYVYLVENFTKEECPIPTSKGDWGINGTFQIYGNQTGVKVEEGDKIYFQGTLEFNSDLKAKQLYMQTNLNNWQNQSGQVWVEKGIEKGSYNFAVAYDVTASENLTSVQIAVGSGIDENSELTVTVKDFYVVHIVKEKVETVFPIVYTTQESPVELKLKTGEGADGKIYEKNINTNSVAFAAGDTIEFTFEIPAGADISGAQQFYMQTNADGWGWHSTLYKAETHGIISEALKGVITASCKDAVAIDSINLNYGIQKAEGDSVETFILPITNVTLRKIPKFTSNK